MPRSHPDPGQQPPEPPIGPQPQPHSGTEGDGSEPFPGQLDYDPGPDFAQAERDFIESEREQRQQADGEDQEDS